MIKDVMIIDDNKIDLYVTKKMVEKCKPDIRARTFSSGRMALDYLKLCQKDRYSHILAAPDLILLDINMPLMDGFQFIKELKKQSKFLIEKLDIIMLTSSLYIEDINKSENDTYCSGYLCKPLSVKKITDVYESRLNIERYKRIS